MRFGAGFTAPAPFGDPPGRRAHPEGSTPLPGITGVFPTGSSPEKWLRSREDPCGPGSRVLGAPHGGVAPTGCPRGGMGTGHQERDTVTALRRDPEGRRGPGETAGLQCVPPGWPCPR